MKKNYFAMKLDQFKQKFSKMLIHKKKIKALENFSLCHKFSHSPYLSFIKEALEEDFLEEKEEDFLEYMLERYEMKLGYLVWCHKTKSLKQTIARMKTQNAVPAPQFYFDFNKPRTAVMPNIPTELIAGAAKMINARAS